MVLALPFEYSDKSMWLRLSIKVSDFLIYPWIVKTMALMCLRARCWSGTGQRPNGRGISLLPAFDKIAAGIIGDNPSLTEALR
jgi:hypothetical protein